MLCVGQNGHTSLGAEATATMPACQARKCKCVLFFVAGFNTVKLPFSFQALKVTNTAATKQLNT